MATKKNPVVRHVKAKAKKPSTYAALAGMASGLALVLPQYAVPLGVASVILGHVGAFMPGFDPAAAPLAGGG